MISTDVLGRAALPMPLLPPGHGAEPPTAATAGFMRPEEATDLLLTTVRRILRNEAIHGQDVPASVCSDLKGVVRIVREIHERTGIELSITTWAEASSIAAIGERLAQRRLESSVLVPLQAGVGEPLFLFPAMTGAVVELMALSRSIRHPGPVYALAYPGLDGAERPHESVADLAKDLLRHMRSLHTPGRLHLVGYAFGGSVALEVMRLLKATEVGLLALVDTAVPEKHWPLGVWLRFLLKRKRHAVELLQHVRQRYANPGPPAIVESATGVFAKLPSQMQNVRAACHRAMMRHRPRRYRGKVLYFRAAEARARSRCPAEVWRDVLPRLGFVTVFGNHATLVAPPNVARLGSGIRLSLENLR